MGEVFAKIWTFASIWILWILIGFLYLYYNHCYLLCNNTRNPSVRIKLLLWEVSLLPEFPRSWLHIAMGNLQAAELGLFINLLYCFKSSLRINMKIRLGNFSWVRLEENETKEKYTGKACRIWPRHDPSLGIILRHVLAYTNFDIAFFSTSLCIAWASRVTSLTLG